MMASLGYCCIGTGFGADGRDYSFEANADAAGASLANAQFWKCLTGVIQTFLPGAVVEPYTYDQDNLNAGNASTN